MKKILIFILLSLFIPMFVFGGGKKDDDVASETKCNAYASKGAGVCTTKTQDGYKCKWDGGKKGGGRCYKSKELADEIKVNIESCTQITDSSTCKSSIVNGEECIWKQGACRRNEDDGSNETIIADDQNDRKKQEESSAEKNTNSESSAEKNTNSKSQDWNRPCEDENVMQAFVIIGKVVQVAKSVVPLIIIVLGMVDFGKAVASNDDKAISKAAAALIRRFIAGVVVFFIPTIILAILNLLGITNNMENNESFGTCTVCVLKPDVCIEAIEN